MDPIDAPTVEEAILGDVGNYSSMTLNPTEAAAELTRFLEQGYGVRISREHAMATFADGSFSRLALILKRSSTARRRPGSSWTCFAAVPTAAALFLNGSFYRESAT
jgi:hypothetical protein